MRLIFGDKLQYQTLKGSRKNGGKGATKQTILDKEKVEYVYKQYETRVFAAGKNQEEREARSQRSVFRNYIIKLTRCEHTKKSIRMKNQARRR
jgi:hypothetical protein